MLLTLILCKGSNKSGSFCYLFFSFKNFYAPNVLGDPDNYIPTNSVPTPPHVVPEWYFLPIHAILRHIHSKLGVAAIAPIFIALLALPFFKSMYVRSSSFRPIYQGIFWLLLADRLLLGWIRCQPGEAPFVTVGQVSSSFFLFFVITPILGWVGRGIPNSYMYDTDQWKILTPIIFSFTHQSFFHLRVTMNLQADELH